MECRARSARKFMELMISSRRLYARTPVVLVKNMGTRADGGFGGKGDRKWENGRERRHG